MLIERARGPSGRCIVRAQRRGNPSPWRARVQAICLALTPRKFLHDHDVSIHAVHCLNYSAQWKTKDRKDGSKFSVTGLEDLKT